MDIDNTVTELNESLRAALEADHPVVADLLVHKINQLIEYSTKIKA